MPEQTVKTALLVAKESLQRSSARERRVLNCVPSLDTEDDWTIDTATRAGIVEDTTELSAEVDLREDWWTIRDQRNTGACVGFAAADGVLRWHYVKARMIRPDDLTSPRFIWMANKETDEITDYPTSFVESAGTQTKRALRIAHRYGCVLEKDLEMEGPLWRDSTVSLYSRASRLRIESYFNLGRNLQSWRRWLATKGPILTRLSVDRVFMEAGPGPASHLRTYDDANPLGGHAVALVGYTDRHFIVRNSWGTDWGDAGFAYASPEYAAEAFTEAYGVVVPRPRPGVPPAGPGAPSWDDAPEPISEPRFEGLTIELAEGSGSPLRRARTAARAVLGKRHEWRIESVHPSEPLDFDLLPPLGREGEIDVARAWEITHGLNALDEIAYAEPSFVVFQDNDPGVSIPGSIEAGTTAAADAYTPEELTAAGLPVVERDWRDWSPLFIRARDAWQVEPRRRGGGFPAGKRRGEGVRIGHPDSGYRSHRELWNPEVEPRMRILKGIDRDFVDDDLEPMTRDGDHGLATASVIMSWEPEQHSPSPNHEITGVAPRADIVPLRVAKVRPIIPTPVLLRSGMIRLRKAIDYGMSEGCEIFSISLGWLPNRSLHKAIRRAVANDAIICAAAGNQVRFFVVWPAHYRETIAAAACDYRGGKWRPSSRGKRVDVTAPGKDVWKADRAFGVKASSGTSYSAASTAGVAALWLARWGRDYLKSQFEGMPLGEVFRYVLKRTCTRPSGWNTRKWGYGIVDAKATLERDLPTRAQVRQVMRRDKKADQQTLREPFAVLAAAFEEVQGSTLRRRLAALTGTAEDELAGTYAGFEGELTFHVLTTPRLRNALAADDSPEGDATAAGSREALDQARLSPSLRAVMSAGR